MGCAPSEPEYLLVHNKSKQPSGYDQQSILTETRGYHKYPPPAPPTSRKADIFHLETFAEIDQHASKVPVDFLYGSYEALVSYLTSLATSDLGRVRALFKFATSLDMGMLQYTLTSLPDPDTPLDYLLKINWQMGNHSFFFATLCRTLNIPCVIINGINKSSGYELGEKLNRVSLAAQWNAVLIDNQWRFIDLLWASTCVVGGRSKEWALIGEDEDEDEEEGETLHHVNEFFFLTDPDMLIFTHLPDNHQWQLLQTPLHPYDFESCVYVRERFFQLPLYMKKESQCTCILQAKEGSVDIKFGIKKEGRKAELRYLLFRQRQSRRESVPHFPLEQYVLFQKTEDMVSYTVQFPVSGRFKMDIFGQLPGEHDSLDLVCSYLIDCKTPKVNAVPLPDQPDIGWGPGVEAEDVGLKAKTHTAAAIETNDGIVEIKFDMANELNILQNLKHNDLQEWLLQKHAIMYVENGELTIRLRLPEEGQYALNLFGDGKDKEGDLANVCNYLINCAGSSEQSFPKILDGTLGKSPLAENFKVTPKGVKDGSEVSSFMKACDGSVKVTLEKDKDVQLFCEVNHPDLDEESLAGMVSQKETETNASFHVNFPNKGEYALNIFARKKGDSSRIYHVYSYMVEADAAFSGAKPVKVVEMKVPIIPIQTSSETAVIKVPGNQGELVAELRRKNAIDAPINNHMTIDKDGVGHVINVAVPTVGEYDLAVYERRENGALKLVSAYHIWRLQRDPGEEGSQQGQEKHMDPEELERKRAARKLEAKHKAARDQLRAAIATGDVITIEAAIREFQESDTPDKGEMEKARNTIQYLQITESLSSAMSQRKLSSLEKALAAAENASPTVKQKLGLQLQMAQRISEQLRRIEKLRHAILDLDQKTVAELKSYSQPPPAVHSVMAATFLLLGDQENSVKDWRAVQVLMGKTGKTSLKRRVLQFSVEELSIQVAVAARRMLSDLHLEDVRDVSAGAATFYVWTMGMVEECESVFQQNGGDLQAAQSSATRAKTAGRRTHP